MSYEVGTAFLQIVPSFRGFVDDVDRQFTQNGHEAGKAFNRALGVETADAQVGPSDESSAEQGSSAGGKFADSFRARIDAALRALPSADVRLEDADAQLKLDDIRARLETLRNVDIGVDISDDDALAAISVLKLDLDDLSHRSPDIRVRVDTAEAVSELGAVQAAADAAAGDSSSGGGLLGLGEAAGESSGPIGGAVPAIAALGTALIPIAGLAAGALSTMPDILAGMGLGAGALYLGLSGLTTAIKAYKTAETTAGETAAEVATKQRNLAHAMAGLSPAAQGFVTFVGATLLPAFQGFKTAVQSVLLPELTTALRDLMPAIQAIMPFVVQAAQGIGETAVEFAQWLSSATGMHDLNAILTAGNQFMSAMGDILVGTLIPAFATIAVEAIPILQAMTQEAGTLAQAFAGWVADGGFQHFVTWVMTHGPTIVTDLLKIATAAMKIITGLAPFGGVVLTLVTYGAELLGWLAQTPAALAAVAAALAGLGIYAFIAGGPLSLIGAIVAGLIVTIVELVDNWTAIWTQITTIAAAAWDWLWNNIFGPFVSLFTTTFPAALAAVGSAFSTAWSAITTAVTTAWNALYAVTFSPMVALFRTGIPAAVSFLVGVFTALPGEVLTALSSLWGIITGAFGDVGSWVYTNVIAPVVALFATLPANIGHVLSTIGSTIEGGFISAFNGIAAAWNDTVGAISVTIPSWVPVIGGDHFGVPHIPTYRATGGPVVPGDSYIVGERGPELFVPSAPGVIVPNHDLQAAQLGPFLPQQATAQLAPEDRALLQAIAGRPVQVNLDQKVLATSVQEYANWRRQHGDPVFAGGAS